MSAFEKSVYVSQKKKKGSCYEEGEHKNKEIRQEEKVKSQVKEERSDEEMKEIVETCDYSRKSVSFNPKGVLVR